MTKIKVSLKEEVKRELLRERENYLFESLLPLAEIDDSDLIAEKLGETTLKLLDNGYTPEDISLVIEGWSDIFGGLKDKDGNFNLWNTIFGGGKSAIYEQILRWVFTNVLGFSQSLGQGAAIALTEYNPLHIFRLFRSQQHCVQEIGEGGLGQAITEIFINQSQFQGSEQKPMGAGMIKIAIRNLAAEAVRDSDLPKQLATKICGYIWSSDADGKDEKTSETDPTKGQKTPQGPANIRDN